MFGMRNGQITIINWRDGPSFDLFDIAAITDPFRAQRRQALFNDPSRIGSTAEFRIAPGTARVVNADRLVHFDLAVHRLRRREGYFAERDAKIGMQLAGDENLARIWKGLSDRIYRIHRI